MMYSIPSSPAPTVLLVGFLGAGKTTFIRELLPILGSRGLEPYVLINDYQNARIDAGSLKHLIEEVEAINGNCVCCDSIHELINRLLSIPAKPHRVVLIEANGTTDPISLIEHLTAHTELRQSFKPLMQVGVIDMKRWQNRAWHNALELLQAKCASHLVFTRSDSVKTERCAHVRGNLEQLNPRSVETSPEKLAEELARIVAMAQKPPTPVKYTVKKLRTVHRHDHSLAHGFVAIQLSLPAQVDGPTFYQWLRELPDNVLRVKGIVQLTELPDFHFMFQRTDETPKQPTMFPLLVEPTMPPCAVLIGVRLAEEKIRREAMIRLGMPSNVVAA